jgi:hypothetical protein
MMGVTMDADKYVTIEITFECPFGHEITRSFAHPIAGGVGRLKSRRSLRSTARSVRGRAPSAAVKQKKSRCADGTLSELRCAVEVGVGISARRHGDRNIRPLHRATDFCHAPVVSYRLLRIALRCLR